MPPCPACWRAGARPGPFRSKAPRFYGLTTIPEYCAGPSSCQRLADAFAHPLQRPPLRVYASDAVDGGNPPSRLVTPDGRRVLLRPLRHSLSSSPFGSTWPLPPEARLEIALDPANKSSSEVFDRVSPTQTLASNDSGACAGLIGRDLRIVVPVRRSG